MSQTPTERDVGRNWDSLRRRKVVQWGLAYAAGAWVLLQVIGFAADAFAWQPLIKQLAMLGLVLGLPVVLALAWYHGDRGQQRVTGSEFAVLTLLLLVGGGLLGLYAHRSSQTTNASTATEPVAPSATADTRPSIAVLPFENRSRAEDDAFFVDGIHDDILTQLSKVSALRVISRTSVQRFRKTDLSVQQIAAQLGVKSILEGGVQRAGDRVRINVQLIDATTDAHHWAETYDRELTVANMFAIQSEVAEAIAGALETALTPEEQARARVVPTQNLEAWEAYQIGKQRMASRTIPGLDMAETEFRKAIALDPKFALVWVGLADALSLQTFYAGRPKDAALKGGEDAINRALELNPNLAEAWASAGLIANTRRQYAHSEQLLRRAIALNPNYAPAHHWLGMTLNATGRMDEGLSSLKHAIALDPLSTIINTNVGQALTALGRFDEALRAFKHLMEIDPTSGFSYFNIGALFAYGYGRLYEAPPWYQKGISLNTEAPEGPARLAGLYWELEDDVEADQWLKRSLSLGNKTAYTSFIAALLDLDRGHVESSRKHAQVAADLDPAYMVVLRDHYIRDGNYPGARDLYARAYPELFVVDMPKLTIMNAFAAIDVALLLQHTGEQQRAEALLASSEIFLRNIPRMGVGGYHFSDAAIHALRGEKALAIAKLREAEKAGCRLLWRYHRHLSPNLASIRNEPEFKAIFADIERDMVRQRATLAARPKDAPLDLQATGT